MSKTNPTVKKIIVEKKFEIYPDGRLSANEAARFLDITLPTLYNWIYEKKSPPYVKIGRSVFFYYKDILQWIKEQNKNERKRTKIKK